MNVLGGRLSSGVVCYSKVRSYFRKVLNALQILNNADKCIYDNKKMWSLRNTAKVYWKNELKFL